MRGPSGGSSGVWQPAHQQRWRRVRNTIVRRNPGTLGHARAGVIAGSWTLCTRPLARALRRNANEWPPE